MNRLKGAGTSGCCPCNEFVNCDCGPVSCSVECQSKSAGGGATLIGFSELASPSSPPRKYRTKTFGGGHTRCNFNSAAECGAGIPQQGSDDRIFTLVCKYNKTTGVLTSTGSNVTHQNFGSCPATTVLSTGTDCNEVLTDSGNFGVTTTPTYQAHYIKGQCLLSGAVYSQVLTSDSISLTDEDTEDDAIARADATVPSWSPCVTGCIACPSYKSVRGPGQFNLSYCHTQVRANLNGMVPTHSYTVTFNFLQRLHGTADPWVVQGTATAYITATLETGTTDWVDVPELNGYDVICSGCSAE